MAALVAKRYATALFEAVRESEHTDAATVLQELRSVQQALHEIPAFRQFFMTPVIGDTEKKRFVAETFSEKVSQEVCNFLQVLVDKRRESDYEEMVEVFEELSKQLENRLEATAVTAVAMNGAAIKQLEELLSTKTGKQVTLENKVDESIVGGVLIRIGDQVIDGTVRNRLSLLKEELTLMIVSSEG